ncbi:MULTISPECIES: tetratricopeptide repeat protein [Luteimonas]|uniref:tetratricopeptide repeat protein n=1 Tax=Luteimonas TaxID=83614 RepID=UPI0013044918|nr:MULTISPECIES: tetratricopeptide repeat protein [Luteimonas]
MQEQILDALRRGAHDDALALARDAVAAEPQSANAHRLLALALRGSGDAAAAVDSIDRAIALAPDDADLHFQRAGMLLNVRDIEAAATSLSQSVSLDPNQFGAYILQGQLAIGRSDFDEADRQQKLAARVAPEHPWTTMLAGTLASRRGDHDRALSLLSHANKQAPDDLQVLYALGFAYLARGHLAFAEQTFRRVIESTGNGPLRGVLAQIVLQQGRPADAADIIAELVADPAQVTPAWQTLGGELELQAGRPERAAPLLRAAFDAHPESRRATNALVQLWGATNAADEARDVLDAALATHAGLDHLWLARLAFEPFASAQAREVVTRWVAAMPAHVPALQAQLALETGAGDFDAAETVARAIADVQPGHLGANDYLFSRLLARDPAQAVAFAQGLLAPATDDARLLLQRWVGIAQDAAGQPADAVATWHALNTAATRHAGPPPPPTAAPAQWPEPGAIDAAQPPAVFLYGPPGARVDRIASVLQRTLPMFRSDRLTTNIRDPFQDTTVPAQLAAGRFTAAQVVDSWRQQLSTRAIDGGAVVDWLPWWDNAMLLALRPRLPEGRLLLVLRDPRDMLLDWLAFGTQLTVRLDDVDAAATWLAAHLAQLADLVEQDLYPHVLLRNDDPVGDADTIAATIGRALGIDGFPVPPAQVLGPDRMPAGHWRAYAGVLGTAFASLTPVAVRLGYPQD